MKFFFISQKKIFW